MFGLTFGMEALSGASAPVAMAAAFAGGVVASLTPCIYPMIPIVSGYVGSKTMGERTTLRAFLLSTTYVAGMATIYAGLGVFAALTGSFFGAVSTSPFAYFLVGNLGRCRVIRRVGATSHGKQGRQYKYSEYEPVRSH